MRGREAAIMEEVTTVAGWVDALEVVAKGVRGAEVAKAVEVREGATGGGKTLYMT